MPLFMPTIEEMPNFEVGPTQISPHQKIHFANKIPGTYSRIYGIQDG